MKPTATRRYSRWQLAADAALAAGCAGVSVTVLLSGPIARQVGPGAWVLALLHAAPIAVRRRAPRLAFAVSLVAGAVYLAVGYPMVGLAFTALVIVYSVAAYTSFRESLGALALTEAVFLVAVTASGAAPDRSTLIGDVLALGAAWVLGDATRRRWRLAGLYRERVEELEVAQMALARRAVVEERVRIARELHDVVAHSMSVIAVQAGMARMVLSDEATEAKESLAAIEASTRTALNEMRRLLGVLRDPVEVPERSPMPTLADLDHLVAAAVEAGTPVQVRIEGERRPLAPGRELAAFRIIQEALTNVRRHAPGATAVVQVAFESHCLFIQVENEIPGDSRDGAGFGLIGMRERAAVYGGAIEAGRRDDGVFAVLVRLPYGEDET